MDDRDLRLLEYTAIRHETSIDYKVWQEFISEGVFPQYYFPNLKDLDELNNSFTICTLSERTQVLTDDAIKNFVFQTEPKVTYTVSDTPSEIAEYTVTLSDGSTTKTSNTLVHIYN